MFRVQCNRCASVFFIHFCTFTTKTARCIAVHTLIRYQHHYRCSNNSHERLVSLFIFVSCFLLLLLFRMQCLCTKNPLASLPQVKINVLLKTTTDCVFGCVLHLTGNHAILLIALKHLFWPTIIMHVAPLSDCKHSEEGVKVAIKCCNLHSLHTCPCAEITS